MLSINDYLSLNIDWLEILDQRTLNALNFNANIYTIKDLLSFCSGDYYESKLSIIKGIWLNGINIINNLLKYIDSKDIKLPIDNVVNDNNEIVIDKTISDSNLNLYSSYLSIRTVNSLNSVWINNVWDIMKNRDVSLRWVRWLWKTGLKEIDNFLNYIINNFSIKSKENISDYDLLDIVDDKRIIQVLWFNWINKISEIEKFLESKEKFQELRYLNNNDYILLKEIYNNLFKHEEKKLTLTDNFLNVLNNLTYDEKIIFNERILWSLTLIEVWNKLWITRERVRQKQKIIEHIIQNNSNLFINQNTDLLFKIHNTIKIHDFVFLPIEIKLFDYLWFTEDNTNLLYLFLKWINWLKWEVIDKKNFCILKDDNILDSEDLTNIYLYLNKKLKNNNDDMSLEDLFYEIIFENILTKKIDYIQFKEYIINYLKKIIELHDDYIINKDIIHRFNKKYKLEDYIEIVLENFPDWLHYSEINIVLKNDYNLDYSDIQILNWLWHYWFKNIWLGTYTLKSNNNYSWWKTWDLIYLFLKEVWLPKSLKEITYYILSRKKINEWTVIAAISWYKNENRFVFYKDWKIWLKEWNLWNVREKRTWSVYEVTLSKAFQILKKEDLIPEIFTLYDFRKLVIERFWDKSSSNQWWIYNLLTSLVEKRILSAYYDCDKNIYSLIK